MSALRRKALLIASITTVVTGAALLKTVTETPVYESSLELLAQPVGLETEIISSANPDTLSSEDDVISVEVDDVQLKILKSPRILEPIVEQLRSQYPGITYEQVFRELTVSTGSGAKGPTTTAATSENTILTAKYTSENPQLVKDVLALVGEAYVDYSLEYRQSYILRGIEFVDDQLPILQTRVNELQNKLEALRQQHNLIDPELEGEQTSAQMNSFMQERIILQVDLEETQMLYENLQAELSQNGELASSSVLSEDERYQKLLEKILDVDSEIAGGTVLFLENSPEIQTLEEQRQNLLPLVEKEGERVLRELAARIQELSNRQQALDDAIVLLNRRMQSLSSVARDYSDIQRELDIATKNLSEFLTKREAFRVDAAQQEAPWEVLSQPGRPRKIASSVPQNLILGAALGLILGMGTALALDKLKSIIYTVKEVKNITKLPILGIIPFNRLLSPSFEDFAGQRSFQSGGYSFQSSELNGSMPISNITFFEAFRSVYTNICLLSPDVPIRSLTVVSPIVGAGKTTVSIHLAQAAAAMGRRVLLVDTDLRRPRLGQYFGLIEGKGLTDVISENLPIETVVQASEVDSNLFVLSSGTIPPDAGRVLASQSMSALMEEAAQKFDLVIYDTPPMLGFSDAFLVASQTAGFLLVVGLGKTKRSVLEKAMEELRVSKIPVLGAIANGVQESELSSMAYGYEYYQRPTENFSSMDDMKMDSTGNIELFDSLKKLPLLKKLTKR